MTKILHSRALMTMDGAFVVGVSGIDASGKGYIAGELAAELEASGQRVALINVDGWLNLPMIRFSEVNAAEHFYLNALRLDEMFESLIIPLRDMRSIELTMNFAEETATEFRHHRYAFDNIDIVLLEGIFIFKREYVDQFDLKIWIDCSFETALERAIGRGQEGIGPAATVRAYTNTFFPAQRVHLQIDDPRSAADLIYDNQ